MEALYEYGKFLEQMQREMNTLRPLKMLDGSFGPDKPETKVKERHEKLKIRVHMTRIPAFHKVRPRTQINNCKTFDSAGSNNTENESGSSKQGSPGCEANTEPKESGNSESPRNEEEEFNKQVKSNNGSVQQIQLNTTEKEDVPGKEASWKDYFTKIELEEIADGLNSKEEEQQQSSSGEGDESFRYAAREKYEEEKRKEPEVEKVEEPADKLKINVVPKDLIKIGYVKKNRELWDVSSYNSKLFADRIVHLTRNHAQRCEPANTRPHALDHKRNISHERSSFARPGTSTVFLEDRIKRSSSKPMHDEPRPRIPQKTVNFTISSPNKGTQHALHLF